MNIYGPRHFLPIKRFGQARLYGSLTFYTPDGRARFGAYHSRGLAEPPDATYPYVLTVGRL